MSTALPAAPPTSSTKLVIPPLLRSVQPKVQEMFEDASSLPHAELEGRVRMKEQSHISREIFQQLLRRCEHSKTWSRIEPWQVSADFLFANQLRCSRAPDMSCRWVTKQLVRHLDLKLAPVEELAPLSLRISLKTEVPFAGVPPLEKPHRVRIKKRKVFVYKDLWEFTFTLVWTGKTHAEAIKQAEPQCEVEIEWLSKEADGTYGDSVYLSTSLLLKLLDLLPPPATTSVHLQ